MNKKKKEYDDLQLAISRQKRQKIEKKDRRVVGEYEQFFKNNSININDKKSKNEDSSKYRIAGLKYFAPDRPLKKIQDLERARAMRKQVKDARRMEVQ